MINERELRINNLVEYLGETKKVLGFDEETFYLKNTVSVCYIELDEIYPIPLTEEWLLRFGYVKFRNDTYMISGHLIWTCNGLIMCNKNGIIIKSVHQLQNLYFALTNKELVLQE